MCLVDPKTLSSDINSEKYVPYREIFAGLFRCKPQNCPSHMFLCVSPMFDQAYQCLLGGDMDTKNGYGKKHLWFIKWKFLEAKVSSAIEINLSLYSSPTLFPKFFISDSNYYKLSHQAVAYYYHGLILDKGNEPSCNVSAACCFLAAEELLSESKKACLNFCLAAPVTRFGLIRLLHMGHRSLAILHGIMLGETFFQGFSTRGIYEAFTSENS